MVFTLGCTFKSTVGTTECFHDGRRSPRWHRWSGSIAGRGSGCTVNHLALTAYADGASSIKHGVGGPTWWRAEKTLGPVVVETEADLWCRRPATKTFLTCCFSRLEFCRSTRSLEHGGRLPTANRLWPVVVSTSF